MSSNLTQPQRIRTILMKITKITKIKITKPEATTATPTKQQQHQ